MITRNFDTELNGIRGEIIPRGTTLATIIAGLEKAQGILGEDAARVIRECMNEATGAAVSYADVCGDALVAPLPGEDELPMGLRSRRYALAVRIIAGGAIDLAPEDRDMIKDCVNRHIKGSLIPPQIERFMEGDGMDIAPTVLGAAHAGASEPIK